MNLYKIIFSHHSPKDSKQGIKTLLLAENDEQVYNWICSEPEIEGDKLFNSWKENDKVTFDDLDEDEWEWLDDNGNPELFKDRMLRMEGEIDDDTIDFSDAYYGITLYGWELAKENVTSDYTELIECGLVLKAV